MSSDVSMRAVRWVEECMRRVMPGEYVGIRPEKKAVGKKAHLPQERMRSVSINPEILPNINS